ncbi:dihydrolipoamide acetyltransferase family protein [Kribbella monticola]|uniref:dihydrolipoamide acetyltransferase family protein n=1 Tax=Kribbella monticola TaxID=2185285 RepID=UPI001E42209A|nr:dihydrolipoamide acetyltransferase family protein [Kribbella monticola]
MTTQTFLLPDLGEGLTEAEVVRWLVAVGDVVAVDAPVAEVETAKSIVEVPSPYAGVVAELHADAGTTVDVGKPLITIGVVAPAAEAYREEEKAGSGNVLIGYGTPEGGTSSRRRKRRGTQTAIAPEHTLNGVALSEQGTHSPASSPTTPSSASGAAASSASGAATSSASGGAATSGASGAATSSPTGSTAFGGSTGSTAFGGPTGVTASGGVNGLSDGDGPAVARVPLVISPLVRRLARDAGVDLRTVKGSGAGGLIVRKDVDAAIAVAGEAPVPAPAPREDRTGLGELRRTPMSGFRKAVAATLSRSRAEIPEATTWVDVDATALVELRESLRTATDPGPGLLALMARFVVAGLQKYPELNGFVDTEREELVQYDGINLGLAAQTDRGLVVPAVANAQALTARGLDAEIRRLTASARDGRLSTRELSCGTFTLNNYGSFGVDGSAAIINHPQVAILGVGRIIDRPWVVDGELAIRKLTQLSLVFDHRVCDGGVAAGFLRFVADAFESPTSAFADL